MKTIIITGLSIQFDADQTTNGTTLEQARQAIEQINGVLQRQPLGMAAQIITPGKGQLKAHLGSLDES